VNTSSQGGLFPEIQTRRASACRAAGLAEAGSRKT